MTREGGWLDSKLDLTHTIEISRQPPTHAHAHMYRSVTGLWHYR